MARKPLKSDLERYVGSMMTQLRFRKAKRPEEWLRWTSPVVFGVLVGPGNYALAIGFGVVSVAAQFGLAHRRMGRGTLGEKVARNLPESVLERTHRQLRKGTYDERVGPETRAILESCAASALAVVEVAGTAHFAHDGRPAVLEAFRPMSRSLDVLMREALVRADTATMVGRSPDPETLAELRTIETSLAGLRNEAQRLAREFRVERALPDDIGLSTERAEARRELDQGA